MHPKLAFTGERVIPGRTPIFVLWRHVARYQWVRPAVVNRSVLDIGCGEGYGTYYLAQQGGRAIGMDVAPAVIAHARSRYRRPNLGYVVMDSGHLGVDDQSFDVVCSFEVIEHLDNVDQFLAEVRRVLKPGGVFYVSTPNAVVNTLGALNPFHVREFTLRDFLDLLDAHFPAVTIYGQRPRRPVRNYLFTRSTHLYVTSARYRRLVQLMASLYLRGNRGEAAFSDTSWIERVDPSLFAFSATDLERASNFVGVCRMDPLTTTTAADGSLR